MTLITEAALDDWEMTAQIEADEIFGEFLFNYYGKRPVPGSPMPDAAPPEGLMQQMMGGQMPSGGSSG